MKIFSKSENISHKENDFIEIKYVFVHKKPLDFFKREQY